MNRLKFLPLLAIPALIALVLMGGLVSAGGPGYVETQYSVEVAVNVEDDPGFHALFINMPDNIKLTIRETEDGTAISGPAPWIDLLSPVAADGTLTGGGIGSVERANGEDIVGVEVRFEGEFDPSNAFGDPLSGLYSMGVNQSLPGDPPETIVYQIKAKPGGSTVRGGTLTPTAGPATPTVPALEPPTDVPPAPITPGLTGSISLRSVLRPNDSSDKAGEGVPGFMINFYRGRECTVANFMSSAVTDAEGYATHGGLPKDDQIYSAIVKTRKGWNGGFSFCVHGIIVDLTYNVSMLIDRDGDINKDGITNSIDSLLLLQTIAGLFGEFSFPGSLSQFNFLRADVNNDGDYTSVDASLILQFVAGLVERLPVGDEAPLPPPVITTVPPAPPTVTPTLTATPPMSQPPTGSPTPPPPTATSTSDTAKISLTISGGPSRPVKVYQSEDCSGGQVASINVSGSLSLSFNPDDYSVLAEDVKGWELTKVTVDGEQVTPLNACQTVGLNAGEKVAITFTYQ